jgi:hypothetical protein
MSYGKTLANPFVAFGQASDIRTGKYNNGAVLEYDADYENWRANATITKGQALMFVAATATVPVSVTPMTAAGDKRLFVGVANEAAAAGQSVQVVTKGFCLINVGAGAPAALDLFVLPATTTGVFDTTSTDPDATTVVGTVGGVVLFTKGSDNLAPAYLSPR